MNPCDEVFRLLKYQPIPNDADRVTLRGIRVRELNNIGKTQAYTLNECILMVSIYSYIYGVMQGKRAERARRKRKAAIGAGTPIAATDTKISCPCVMCEYTTQTHQKERGIECSTI